MPTLKFSRNIRRRGRQFENSASELVRRMAKRTLRQLVELTKVDTGAARSNWRVGIGAPARSVIAPYNPYPKGSRANGAGASETANAIATIRAGNARINAVRGLSGVGLKTGVFISNNTEHVNAAISQDNVEHAILDARIGVRGFRLFVNR